MKREWLECYGKLPQGWQNPEVGVEEIYLNRRGERVQWRVDFYTPTPPIDTDLELAIIFH